MNEITTFNFNQVPVRVVMRNGDPEFVASDVASILGYRMPSDLSRILDDDQKGTQIVQTLGGDIRHF